jgi:predicted AAA+ superfamily ATPase
MIPRALQQVVFEDLREKMVFLAGPRQVGKTTLARGVGTAHFPGFAYCNWDSPEDRGVIRRLEFSPQTPLLIFDEIHKFPAWKNHVKGLFDTRGDRFRILVTGSARLDIYRRGGDSLQGRYHLHRMHPLTVGELAEGPGIPPPGRELNFPAPDPPRTEAFTLLLKWGGFPEPFQKQNDRFWRRWQIGRHDRLVHQDIRDVSLVRDLSKLDAFIEMLPGRVGSLFSLNSLCQTLEATHRTVSAWADLLERFYVYFRIRPFHVKTTATLRKEPKAYLWDWSAVPEGPARLENMVASHLLKLAHAVTDREGYRAEVHFLRDQEQREVDFLMTVNRKPWFAVEVKWADAAVDRQVHYFQEKLGVPVYQVTAREGVDFLQRGVRVMSASRFLAGIV